jgi:hypothetical protein
MFSWHIGLWNFSFFHRPERNAGGAIQHKQESLLGWLSDNVHVAPVMSHG